LLILPYDCARAFLDRSGGGSSAARAARSRANSATDAASKAAPLSGAGRRGAQDGGNGAVLRAASGTDGTATTRVSAIGPPRIRQCAVLI
jgi:hypothetical protein